jgi:hypothetical protein
MEPELRVNPQETTHQMKALNNIEKKEIMEIGKRLDAIRDEQNELWDQIVEIVGVKSLDDAPPLNDVIYEYNGYEDSIQSAVLEWAKDERLEVIKEERIKEIKNEMVKLGIESLKV